MAQPFYLSGDMLRCKDTKKYPTSKQILNKMPENIQKIIKNILRDIAVDMKDEFDFIYC